MKVKNPFTNLITITLVFLLFFPVQTIWAAADEVNTKIIHKPPKDEYIPGYLIQLIVKIKDKTGLLAKRCYFKAKIDNVFTFVDLDQVDDNQYQAVLPAPWINSEYIEYTFVSVNKAKQVTRTQLFKIGEAETDETAEWQDTSEVEEARVDQVQEAVEAYETLRKELREKYRKKKAKYQVESQGVMTIFTEVDESLVSFNGFYDGITVSKVPVASSYGLLAEGIFTTEQVAYAGGANAVSSATGATNAGTITATPGLSTVALVGIGLGATIVLGGGVAAIGGSDGGGSGGDTTGGGTSSFTGTFVASNVNGYDIVTLDLIQSGNLISGSYHGEADSGRARFITSVTGSTNGLSVILTCQNARGYQEEAGWYPLPSLEGTSFNMTLVNNGEVLRGDGGNDFIRQ